MSTDIKAWFDRRIPRNIVLNDLEKKRLKGWWEQQDAHAGEVGPVGIPTSIPDHWGYSFTITSEKLFDKIVVLNLRTGATLDITDYAPW